ncbi:MAG: hypothetical protein HYX72_10430 [Acidobacteria bacterium]|nr:hypothetical protein [Acidobacteriota bacterium]
MAGESNRLELVVDLNTGNAEVSAKSMDQTIGRLGRTPATRPKKPRRGLTAWVMGMAKGVLAGNAIYDTMKRAVAAFESFTFGAIRQADEMGKAAQKIGMGIQEYSELRHIAELSGIAIGQLSTGVGILSKNMLEAARGSKTQRDVFAALRVEFQNSNGTLRDVNAVLESLADRFQAMPDGATKTALAMALLGRSGKEMIPLLNQGGDALRATRAEAGELGRVITEQTFRAAEQFNDSLTRLKGAVEGVSFKLAAALLPEMNRLTDGVLRFVKESEGVNQVAESFRFLFREIATFGTVAVGVMRQLLLGMATGLQANLQMVSLDFKKAIATLRAGGSEMVLNFESSINAVKKIWDSTPSAIRETGPKLRGALTDNIVIAGEEAARQFEKWADAYDRMNDRLVESIKRTSPYLRQIAALAKVEGDAMVEAIKKTSPYLEEQAALQAMLAAAAHSRRESEAADTQQRIVIAEYERGQLEKLTREAQDRYMEVFNSLKSQAGGVFDALVTKSKSAWETIGDLFKTTILTAIKDTFSTVIAQFLTPFMAAMRQAITGGATGGGFSPATAMGAALPAIGGFGVAGPGGTAPTFPTGGAGAGGLAGGILPGLKSLMGIGAGAAAFGGGMGGSIAGGLTSPAAGLAGLLMLTSGARGAKGLGLNMAGGFLTGASIGMMLGGPIGAGIGALAGTAAGGIKGLIGMFGKSAEDKAKEKIKAAYGITIEHKGVLQQIVEMAKQFGGNLDTAIRSPQIRDLIYLYGMTRGHNAGGLTPMSPVISMAQSGGVLSMQSGPAFGGMTTTIDRISAGRPSNGTPTVLQATIKIDGAATTALLRGEAVDVITKNSRLVSNAVVSGHQASAGRRELAASTFGPGELVS